MAVLLLGGDPEDSTVALVPIEGATRRSRQGRTHPVVRVAQGNLIAYRDHFDGLLP